MEIKRDQRLATIVRVFDKPFNTYHYGIMIDGGKMVCGCCGHIYSSQEISTDLKIEEEFDFEDLTSSLEGIYGKLPSVVSNDTEE